ncbi:MAG: hypothetical protein MRJ65_11185 [Candidatus Brocadiaceae bacterium]|nr:hypothetical protein [Candidatus Brocadiaceae bacterium]
MWRESIGLVILYSTLLHTTIAKISVCPEEALNSEKIRIASRKAHAFGFIDALEYKLNTVIGEKGGRLSGGKGRE